MKLASILLLAFGLSMDAMAVAATRGLSVREIRFRHVLIVAVFFGGFQALMPLVGWLLGSQVGAAIADWDHWVVFVLLGGIGGKMLWEAWQGDEDAAPVDEASAFGLRVMLMLAIATSIDALAAGFTLPLIGAPLVMSIAAIGIVTAVLSAIGLFAGQRFGAALGKRLDVVGGVVLIGIGLKTLIQHLNLI